MKCNVCGRDNLTEDDFHTDNRTKNKKSYRCKMCNLRYMKAFYLANKAHLQKRQQERVDENKRLVERCKELIRIFSVFFPENYKIALQMLDQKKERT